MHRCGSHAHKLRTQRARVAPTKRPLVGRFLRSWWFYALPLRVSCLRLRSLGELNESQLPGKYGNATLVPYNSLMKESLGWAVSRPGSLSASPLSLGKTFVRESKDSTGNQVTPAGAPALYQQSEPQYSTATVLRDGSTLSVPGAIAIAAAQLFRRYNAASPFFSGTSS